MSHVRILLLADTHLGIDLPVRPRVERRRRGHDFFRNFERALAATRARRVDLVVHGGDLFYRSRVPASLVHRAFEPLKRVADAGPPIYLVPGNHERSQIPYALLAQHPRIHIFDRPTTFVADVRGTAVALAGFPYCRHDVRGRFPGLLEDSGWRRPDADIRILVMHHCVEGATVGPADFTFRYASDVVRTADLPRGLAAVLTGHVHRHQVLTRDLRGRPLAAPVHYPGSVERTSFAERDEPKGYEVLTVAPGDRDGGTVADWEFCPLPARPMIDVQLHADGAGAHRLHAMVQRAIDDAPNDAVLLLRVRGYAEARRTVAAAMLRAMAPASMNVDIRFPDLARSARGETRASRRT